jgi:predicted transcriptional regulator
MKQFDRVFAEVTQATDRTSSYILAIIIANYDGRNKPKIQQTHIARQLKVTRQTIKKYINQLVQSEYIKAKPSYYINANGVKFSTTEFEILPKLKRLINTNGERTHTQQDRTPPPQPIEQENGNQNEVNFFDFFQIPTPTNENNGLNMTTI